MTAAIIEKQLRKIASGYQIDFHFPNGRRSRLTSADKHSLLQAANELCAAGVATIPGVSPEKAEKAIKEGSTVGARPGRIDYHSAKEPSS